MLRESFFGLRRLGHPGHPDLAEALNTAISSCIESSRRFRRIIGQGGMMPTLEYYFATLSPNVYLAGTRMEEVAARHGLTVVYKPLDIAALFARTGGTLPKDRHRSRQEYRLQELRRNALKAGLPLHSKTDVSGLPMRHRVSYAVIAAQKRWRW